MAATSMRSPATPGGAITATGVASKGGRIFLTAEGGSVNVTQKVVARRIQADAAPAPTRAGIAGRRSFTGGDVVVSGDKVVVGGAIEAKGNGGAGGTVVVTGTDVTLTSGAAIDASGTSGGTVLIGGDRARRIGRRAEVSAADHRQCAEHDDRGGRDDHGRRHIGRRRQCGGVVGWHDVVCRRHQHAGSARRLHRDLGPCLQLHRRQRQCRHWRRLAARSGGSDDRCDARRHHRDRTQRAAAMSPSRRRATGSGGNGDITVASGISWSTNATLTLSAYRNIAVNANIASTGGGGVVLRADNAGTGTGTVTFGGGQVSTGGDGLDLLQSDRQQFDRQRHQIHGADADELQRQRHRRRHAQDHDAGQHCLRPAEHEEQPGRHLCARPRHRCRHHVRLEQRRRVRTDRRRDQLQRKLGRPGPHDLRPLHQSDVNPKRRADQLSRRRRHGEQRRRHRCDRNRP